MALEKQLVFDFYREMKEEERYEKSTMRIYWDKRKGVGRNLAEGVIPTTVLFGFLYVFGNGKEIVEYFRNLF